MHLLPARAHVHEHGRAFVRGVDAREDHLPAAAVRRGQADHRPERHLAGRRRRRLRRRRMPPPARVCDAILSDVLHEHGAVVLEARHVLLPALTRLAQRVRRGTIREGARRLSPERAGDGFAGGVRRGVARLARGARLKEAVAGIKMRSPDGVRASVQRAQRERLEQRLVQVEDHRELLLREDRRVVERRHRARLERQEMTLFFFFFSRRRRSARVVDGGFD